MRMMVAKEYFGGQIPLVGEYSIYKCNDKHFFTIGDGCTPIDHLIDLPGHLVVKVSETEFLLMKRMNEKYPPEKGPYHWADLKEEEMILLQEMFKFDASKE